MYAATRLLGRRLVTQAELAEAVSRIQETSRSRIRTYSRAVFDAYVEEFGSDDPATLLERSPITSRAD